MKLTTYEWDIETVTVAPAEPLPADEEWEEEVLDHDHRDRLAEFDPEDVKAALMGTLNDEGNRLKLVLVRDSEQGRAWAYVEDKRLPSHFADAYQRQTAFVADKWHDELRLFRVTHLVG